LRKNVWKKWLGIKHDEKEVIVSIEIDNKCLRVENE
jgi:hypothetical protein